MLRCDQPCRASRLGILVFRLLIDEVRRHRLRVCSHVCGAGMAGRGIGISAADLGQSTWTWYSVSRFQ